MYVKRLFIFYSNWFLYKIIHRIPFDMLENKTILKINNTKHGFIKTSMQIIHIIYNVNFYFWGTNNMHCRILNALITWACLVYAPGVYYLFELPGPREPCCQAISAGQFWVHSLALEAPQYGECQWDQAFFETAMHKSWFVRVPNSKITLCHILAWWEVS